MDLDCAVTSYLGTDNFADYEQEIYRKFSFQFSFFTLSDIEMYAIYVSDTICIVL